MKKRKSIVLKLILCFLLAIIIPLSYVSMTTIHRTKTTLANNIELTSLQTLKESKSGFQQYLKVIAQKLNLITCKNEIKYFEKSGNIKQDVDAIQDTMVAALSTTAGAVRARYATTSRKVVTIWYTVENAAVTPHQEIKNADLSQESWFTNAVDANMRNGEMAVFSEPYRDEQTGDEIITVSQEVKVNDTIVGVVAIDIKFSEIQTFVKQINLLNTGFVILVNEKGDILVNNKGNKYAQDSIASLAAWKQIDKIPLASIKEDIGGQTVQITAASDTLTSWKLVGFVSQAEIADNLKAAVTSTIVTASVAIILGVLIAVIVTILIKRKLNYVNSVAESVAKGDLTQTAVIKGNDEFTDLAFKFNKMIASISELITNVDRASNLVVTSSKNISKIAKETTDASKGVFISIEDVAQSATTQVARVQEASREVDNLAGALDETKNFITEKFSKPGEEEFTSEDIKQLSELVEKANKSKAIATARVENIAADSEEIAAAAEEVTGLTKGVSQSMQELGENTNKLNQTAEELKLALERFKLKQ